MSRKNPRTARIGTKSRTIADLCDTGKSKRETYAILRDRVQAGAMVFSANVGGRRVPKSLSAQLQDLKNEIGRVYSILGRSASADFDSDDIPANDVIPQEEPEEEPEEEEPEEEPKPKAKGKVRLEDSLREFLRRIRELRSFCEERAALSTPLDHISMRPAQAAARLIPKGVPVAALLDACTLHWPKDARQSAGVENFDFRSLSQSIMRDRGISTITRADGTKETPHYLFGYALVLAEARQPIMLVGPAGTGKSHLAAQLADFMGLRYGETPMSPGATRGDLLGRHTIGGFITAEFVELYGNGGVFNFEEIDASDASMLIVLNNALASGKLYNSASGEMVTQSVNFVAFSTANTFGLGANRDYTARERLDAATIDRWRMGRIVVTHDDSVEESILGL